MLLDTITRVSALTGIDVVQQRDVLVNLYNAAARVFHSELDANKMYREVTLIVPPDKLISLPSYIGEVKGLRVHSTEQLVPLQSINVPRYTNTTLVYKIKNWRDLGDSPIMRNMTSVGKFTITCNNVESTPVTLKVCGQTSNAARYEEEIVLSTTSVDTVSLFGPRIDSIACFDKRDNDITITDINGVVMAVLYNKDKMTRYKIMDVSQIFWPQNDTIDGNSFIDVCYKLKFFPLKNDTDIFAGGEDYDEAMYHMCMHLYYMTQSGQEQNSNASLIRATQLVKAAKDGSEVGVQKRIQWGRNKFYDLFTRGRHRMSGNDYGMLYGDFLE